MSKTPEQMAEEYSKVNTSFVGGAFGSYRQGLFEGFLVGYQAGYNEAKKYWANQPKYDVETEEK